MSESYGYFDAEGAGFTPRPVAASQWSADQIVGPALCGLLARALENDHGADGFVPVRLTVDLFKPARMRPLTVTTSLVRGGNRIRLADAAVVQDGAPAARASVVFLRPSQDPPGAIWTRDARPLAPPAEYSLPGDGPAAPMWHSDDSEKWSRVPSEHENASRKRSWQRPLRVVAGEPLSPFVLASMAAEQTSMVTNWSDAGVGFINTDLTVAFARLPRGAEIGLEADNHLGERGIAVGTATLFDRHGPFGSAMITAVANAARQITAGHLDGVIAAAGG
ncbi:acyl-CoA thioesterase domain-containing protein [Nocardia blacklockiae]|uniref:acyl-CoA thioesterase domain-containing protein n=1 Tax=Nocardia blacklockiae TaxID=480036 RepID=UPI001893C82B|nr:acyl-CoA thioesterase domain-containing protein [Nocardia blacklockiae]MBF6175712.1 thioesterase family protein [Nocardia blacklockiae]